jgi:hypothetical protein
LARPLERAEWIGQTIKNIRRENATEADREEYRKLLDEMPELATSLEKMYFRATRKPLEKHPSVDEDLKRRRKLMRAALLGPAPSELEKLLVEVVLSAHADYWHFAVMYKQQTAGAITLRDMEQWERVLNAKEQRYLRAIPIDPFTESPTWIVVAPREVDKGGVIDVQSTMTDSEGQPRRAATAAGAADALPDMVTREGGSSSLVTVAAGAASAPEQGEAR